MNKQVNIIDNQNQTMMVDCICYFLSNQNNKRYLFYTKNEFVQDGLIKMYVAEENNGLANEISLDEWNSLKSIMQDIIKGNIEGKTTNLPVNGSIKLGGEKVIALNQNNIDVIRNSYINDQKVMASQTEGSNKDLLSQSFGTNNSSVETVEPPVVNTVEQVANVPTTNSVDLESSSANLNMELPTSQPLPNLETNMVNIDTVNSELEQQEIPTQNEVNQDIFSMPTILPIEPTLNNNQSDKEIESEFKVSSEPNIFDMPSMEPSFNIETTNNVQEVSTGNNIVGNSVDTNQNVFDDLPTVPSVSELKQEPEAVSEEKKEIDLDDDILKARIAIEKSNYKLYMSLAENSSKMAELLEKQIKSKNVENNLENTAANLFDSTGALDDDKVMKMVA